jgi:protein-disulfide isomerase
MWILGLTPLAVAVPGGSTAQEVDLEGIGYVLGSPEAPVAVVELGDFGCWACALFHRTTWPTIEREFVQTGRVRWRHVPFLFGLRHGDDGTKAAECAADQGQYWEMHDLLFTRHEEWTKPRNPKDFLHTYAKELVLDAEAFETCYKDDHGKARTRRATRAADHLDVSGTPTFFINGSRALGALTTEVFRALLEDAERGVTPGR